MRIAASVLMIIGGSFAPVLVREIERVITVAPHIDYPTEFFFLVLGVSLGITVGGGISAIRRKYWSWALAGSICALVIGLGMFVIDTLYWRLFSFRFLGFQGLVPVCSGILSAVFVMKSKREFQV